jgi:hypothetical protein
VESIGVPKQKQAKIQAKIALQKYARAHEDHCGITHVTLSSEVGSKVLQARRHWMAGE